MAKARKAGVGKYLKKAALAGGVAASATALTVGLAAPSASAAAALAHNDTVQLVDASGKVIPTAVAEALADVLQAYADGNPPTRFPQELRELFGDLSQLGPDLLAALGSDENIEYLRSLDFSFVLEELGLDLPNVGDLLDGIPTSFPIGDEEIDLPINIITTGAPFGALSMFGLNPLWTPGFPNAIAQEINGSPYSSIDMNLSVPPTEIVFTEAQYQQFRQQAYDLAYDETYDFTYPGAYDTAYGSFACRFFSGSRRESCAREIATPIARLAAQGAGAAARALVPRQLNVAAEAPLELESYRIPIVLGFGLGSLTAGMAYEQVVADLVNQPGGLAEDAEAGSSLTILPMILLRNPGRANGGIAARFASFTDLIGLNTVTPDGDVEQSGNAVLVPVKLDATVEYDLLSDFPAWANPFSLANSAAAFAFPTYILRGTDIDNLDDTLAQVLEPVLGGVLGNVISAVIDDGVTVDVTTDLLGFDVTLPLSLGRSTLLDLIGGVLPDEFDFNIPEEGFQAVNEYLTLRTDALPLLEPFRIPFDLLNVATGGNFSNPFADAVEDALRILVNLGYTDVDQENGYERTHDEAGLNANEGGVPFGTRPADIDWERVPEDVFTALVGGFEREFLSGGIPGVNDLPQRNPIADVLGLLGLPTSPEGFGDLVNLLDRLPGLSDVIDDVFGGPSAASSVPDTETLRTVTVSSTAATEPEQPSALQSSNVAQPQSSSKATGLTTEAAKSTPVTSSKANDATLAEEAVIETQDEKLKPTKRPLHNVVTGRGNSATDVTRTPIREAATNAGEQLRDTVRDFRTAVQDAPKRVKETVGAGARTGSGTSAGDSGASAGDTSDD